MSKLDLRRGGVVKPPTSLHDIQYDSKTPSVFLGGSIEMGKATDWQTIAQVRFVNAGFVVFNPRRDAWDSSWEQSIDNPHFREQVEWEWFALQISAAKLFYFEPKTLSPISLMEFGRHCTNGGTHVVCPDGYWRKGNIDVVCAYECVEQNATLDEAIERIIFRFGRRG